MIVLLVQLPARDARANETPQWVTTGPDCPLPHSPFSHEKAAPRSSYEDTDPNDLSFVCSLDQDEDGFDDHIESVIADCFAPYLKFDSAENDVIQNTKFPNGSEPVPLYTVDPQETSSGTLTARLHYVLLYDWDGGFHDAGGVKTDWDYHRGDSQGVEMGVELERAGPNWIAHLRSVHNWYEGGPAVGDKQVSCEDKIVFNSGILIVSERTCSSKEVEHLEVLGTHPVLYPSDGKHHTYHHAQGAYMYSNHIAYVAQYTIPIWYHVDRANGTGYGFVVGTHTMSGRPLNVGRVVSQSEVTPEEIEQGCEQKKQLELAYSLTCDCTGDACPPQPPQEDCDAWLAQINGLGLVCIGSIAAGQPSRNECIAHLKGEDAPSDFLSDNDLHAWYPGANIASGKKFCGTEPEGCDTLAGAILGHIQYSGPSVVDTDGDGIPNYDDLCPLYTGTGDTIDSDGDGAADPCDPSPKRWDRWVGPGSSVRNLGAKKKTAFTPQGDEGWLDTDGDGWINSKEGCPFTAGISANTNGEGEQLAFPAGTQRYVRGGYSRRGNACDPLESTFIKARLPPEKTWAFSGCKGSDEPVTLHVEDNVYVMYASVFGLSPNDPDLAAAKTYKERAAIVQSRSKTVQTTPERCACNLDDRDDCLELATATCYGVSGLNGNAPLPGVNESGWLPLGREGCVEDAEGYCSPIFDTAAPKTPVVCDPIKGTCDKPPQGMEAVSTKYLAWSWSKEKAKHPDHLPSELFLQTDADYLITAHPVLFGSEVGRNAAVTSDLNFNKTGKAPYFNPVTVFGQEPDVNVSRDPFTGSTPLAAGDWLLQTRRLRSFVSSESGHLTEDHDVLFTPIGCKYLPKQGFEYTDLVNIVLPSAPETMQLARVSPVSLAGAPRGWAFVRTTRAAPSQFVALLSLSSGHSLPINIVPALGIAAPGAAVSAPAGDLSDLVAATGAHVVPLAAPHDESEPLPALLVVIFASTPEAAGQWLELAPVGRDPSAGLQYVVGASGSLPSGAGPGVLRGDSIEGSAVLFSEARERPARLWRFEGRAWTETHLVVDVPVRSQAAYLVHGGVLFRAGGADADGAVRGDVTAIDSRSGRDHSVTSPWPARLDPALGWDSEQKGLVYGGGIDQNGVAHSDLWWSGIENAAPVLLAPDVPGPHVTSNSLVIGSGDEPTVLVVSTGTSGIPGLVADAWAASRAGWQPRDLLALGDTTSIASCADGTSARLCAATQSWWSDPGHVTCEGSGCQVSSARSLSTFDVLPLAKATAADLDGLGAWVAVGTRVERWTLDHPPVRTAALELGAQVRDVRVDGASAGASTEKGFVLISRNADAFAASTPLELCGSPLSAEPMGGGSWAVATSTGIAFVAPNESGALTVGQAARLIPEDDEWMAVPVVAGDPSCKPLDAHVCSGHRCDAGRERAPMAFTRERVVLAPPLGPKPFELGFPKKGGKPFDDTDDWSDASVLLLEYGANGWHVGGVVLPDGSNREGLFRYDWP